MVTKIMDVRNRSYIRFVLLVTTPVISSLESTSITFCLVGCLFESVDFLRPTLSRDGHRIIETFDPCVKGGSHTTSFSPTATFTVYVSFCYRNPITLCHWHLSVLRPLKIVLCTKDEGREWDTSS